MAKRIATLSIDALLYRRISQVSEHMKWGLLLILVFGVWWAFTHDAYFACVTAVVAFVEVNALVAYFAMTSVINAKLREDMEKRGLKEIQFVDRGLFFAQYDAKRVRGRLDAEPYGRISVWIEDAP
jgi:hypothetical protein